jgi:hypothetical protein
MGSAAPASVTESFAAPESSIPTAVPAAAAPEPPVALSSELPSQQPSQAPPHATTAPLEKLQNAVLQALIDGNQRILVSMLEAGEWSLEGNEIVIKVAESQTVVDLSISADAKRLAIAAASGVLGRPAKLKIVSDPRVSGEKSNSGASKLNTPISTAGGRSRAEQDTVVRRLQEKFGAQIRTVIDYKEKR